NFKTLGGMRGVGWVILFQDPLTGGLTNYWVSLHQDGIPARCRPLLVMDVWEHAFMRDYRASERLRYVDAFFTNIDWTTAERIYNEERPRLSPPTPRRGRPVEVPPPPPPALRLHPEDAPPADETIDRVHDAPLVDEHVVDLRRAGLRAARRLRHI